MDKKIMIGRIRSQPYVPSRRCTVNHEELGRVSQTLPIRLSLICTHRRMISDCVTKEEHIAGLVRCMECERVIPDPHL